MFRYYRALPEGNRPCIKASRERAYQQHMDALKRMRTCVNTTQPSIPQTIGRNYKRYENEQQRNITIMRDNRRLLGKMSGIQRAEHYPRAVPQRPYTLMGQAQKDEMARITRENGKILTAVQERRPILNRNEWLQHRLDHQYQITKMSEYKKTVPMGEIIRQEQARMQTGVGEPSHGSHSRPPSYVTHGEEEAGDRLPDVISDTLGTSDREEEQAPNQKPIPDVIGQTLAGRGEEEGGAGQPLSDVISDTLTGA